MEDQTIAIQAFLRHTPFGGSITAAELMAKEPGLTISGIESAVVYLKSRGLLFYSRANKDPLEYSLTDAGERLRPKDGPGGSDDDGD